MTKATRTIAISLESNSNQFFFLISSKTNVEHKIVTCILRHQKITTQFVIQCHSQHRLTIITNFTQKYPSFTMRINQAINLLPPQNATIDTKKSRKTYQSSFHSTRHPIHSSPARVAARNKSSITASEIQLMRTQSRIYIIKYQYSRLEHPCIIKHLGTSAHCVPAINNSRGRPRALSRSFIIAHCMRVQKVAASAYYCY